MLETFSVVCFISLDIYLYIYLYIYIILPVLVFIHSCEHICFAAILLLLEQPNGERSQTLYFICHVVLDFLDIFIQ